MYDTEFFDILDVVDDTVIPKNAFYIGGDIIPPILQSFTSTTPDGDYTTGQNINITATYSENLAVGSTMTVVLDTGASVVLSTISTTTLSGTYTIQAGEVSSDLTVSSISSEAVEDAAGNTRNNSSVPASNIADSSELTVNLNSGKPTGLLLALTKP